MTIDTLTNEALLNIFTYCRKRHDDLLLGKGRALIDVCRRWRHIVFASPRQLDLQLSCNSKTPTRTSLDIWPPCPISVDYGCPDEENEEGEENIVAGLERSDRVIDVRLSDLTRPALKKFTAVMTVPFPALKELRLSSLDEIGLFLPATFLGEFAPSLQLFSLDGIAFRTIRRLLSSAHHLVDLHLTDIPINCHVPPHTMVACLSASPHLDCAAISFRPDRPIIPYHGPNSRPPTTRTILPSLTYFDFEGDLKYMEDLVSRIDAPWLRRLLVRLFDEAVPGHRPQRPEFPQLRQFIVLTKCLPSYGGYFVRQRPSGWLLSLYP